MCSRLAASKATNRENQVKDCVDNFIGHSIFALWYYKTIPYKAEIRQLAEGGDVMLHERLFCEKN